MGSGDQALVLPNSTSNHGCPAGSRPVVRRNAAATSGFDARIGQIFAGAITA